MKETVAKVDRIWLVQKDRFKAMFVDMLQQYLQFLQSLVLVVNHLMGNSDLFMPYPCALEHHQIRKLGSCGLHHTVQRWIQPCLARFRISYLALGNEVRWDGLVPHLILCNRSQ